MLFDLAPAMLVLALALGAISAEATFRLLSNPLVYSRIDPIVSPKAVAGHVHDILGGSRFRDMLDPSDVMRGARCSSVGTQADKSNYWTPVVYYINPNGTYSALHKDTLLYYHTKGSTTLNAFPDGLRMISGLATKRDIGSLRTFGIQWSVNPREPDEPKVWNRKFMPNGTNVDVAPRKITSHIYFPSCGLANKALDSADHFSHMTWPVAAGGGRQWIEQSQSPSCPSTHPISYPEIHVENFYTLSEEQQRNWRKGQANLILANGDMTGTTMHADFVNGWDGALLQRALKDTNCLDPNPDNCPVITRDQIAMEKCRLEGQIVDEDVGAWMPIKQLPGCNPAWDWKGPINKPTGPCTPTPGFVSANLQLSPGWSMALPLALPGTSGDPLKYGACTTTHKCPVMENWGVNVPWVMKGTQADVNNNVLSNANNNRMKVPGLQMDNAYNALAPTKVYGTATGPVITMTSIYNYACSHTSPFGMACPLPGTTNSVVTVAKMAAAAMTEPAAAPMANTTTSPSSSVSTTKAAAAATATTNKTTATATANTTATAAAKQTAAAAADIPAAAADDGGAAAPAATTASDGKLTRRSRARK